MWKANPYFQNDFILLRINKILIHIWPAIGAPNYRARSLCDTKRTIFALNHCYYFCSVSRLCQTYYNDGLCITRFIQFKHWQPTMHNEPNEKHIESQKSVRNGCSDQQKKRTLRWMDCIPVLDISLCRCIF